MNTMWICLMQISMMTAVIASCTQKEASNSADAKRRDLQVPLVCAFDHIDSVGAKAGAIAQKDVGWKGLGII